jgi:hypothetical protein
MSIDANNEAGIIRMPAFFGDGSRLVQRGLL